MAGRGRGRGRGSSTAAITDALGVGRGEILSSVSVHQPPALFPTLEFKPLPFPSVDDDRELIKLKQTFRRLVQAQPYFLQRASTKRDVDRYTDRYLAKEQIRDDSIPWTPQWNRLPAELKLKVSVPRKRAGNRFTPRLGSAKKQKVVDVTKTLEVLEAAETETIKTGEEKEEEDKEEEASSESEYDEEQEEGTDYVMTYFDNGEDYGMDDDDNLDGEATY